MKKVVNCYGTNFDMIQKAIYIITDIKEETSEFQAKLLQATLQTDEYKKAFEAGQGKTQENTR